MFLAVASLCACASDVSQVLVFQALFPAIRPPRTDWRPVGKNVTFSESRLMAGPCPICLRNPLFSGENVLTFIGILQDTA